jgi:hypothetical protein
MAESLRDWLGIFLQGATPFVSSQDIAKGDRGLRVIEQELAQSASGIICVTRENSLAPWINFEAGALSKAVGETRVIPCLLDLPVSDLTGPLAQFQAVSSSDKGEVLAMLRSLRDHAGLTNPTDVQLGQAFDAYFWPDLESRLAGARSMASPAASATPARATDEVLEEVLVLAGRQESVLRMIAERVDSSGVPMQQIGKSGADSSSDKSEVGRNLLDDLLTALPLRYDRAKAYRVVTDRIPAEIQVVYDSGTVSADNVDSVRSHMEEFANSKGVSVTLRSSDGYEIITGPGKRSVVLAPPRPAADTEENPREPAGD